MAFINLFGPQGTIITSLERILPGVSLWLMILTIFVFILFLARISNIEENLKEILGYFVILGLLSLLLTGNMVFLIAIMTIAAGIWYIARLGWSRAEHVTAGERALERRYWPEEEKFREQAESVERTIEKKLSKEAPEEAELIKEEREIETIEEYEDVLLAAGEDLAISVQQAIASEKKGEEKEQSLINSLSDYGNTIEQSLERMKTMNVIDTTGKKYVLSLVQGMAQTSSQIVTTEQQIGKDRLQFIMSLVKDVEILDEVINHAKKLSKGASQIDKKLSRNLGAGIIAKAQGVLTSKKAKLKALYAALVAAKVGKNQDLIEKIQSQMAQLKSEIAEMEKSVYQLVGMKVQIKATINEVAKVLAEIRKALNVMQKEEKNITAHEKKLTNFQSQLSKALDRLQKAGASFNATVVQLGKEDVEIAEQVTIDATTGVGAIFTELLSIATTQKEFHQEGTLPFVEDIQKVLIEGQSLAPLMKGLHQRLPKRQFGLPIPQKRSCNYHRISASQGREYNQTT